MPSIICDPPVEHIPNLWPQVEPHIKKALKYAHGCYEPIDILIECLTGKSKLWISWNEESQSVEAAMITRINQYPRKRTCGVPFIGGRNLSGWKDKFMVAVEGYAKANHCSAMEGGSREGWARVAGYRNVGCVLVKEF